MSDWKADLDAFAVWFKEKGGQVEPRQLTAFGIPIDSRYGKAWEIMEMLAFAYLTAQAGIAGYVDSLFYDSKSCCCTVKLKPGTERQPDVVHIVNQCGDLTLSTFTSDDTYEWRGKNQQGDYCEF